MVFHSVLVLHRISCWESVSYRSYLISSSFNFRPHFLPHVQVDDLVISLEKKAIRTGLAVFGATKSYLHQYYAFLPFQINYTCSVLKLRSV